MCERIYTEINDRNTNVSSTNYCEVYLLLFFYGARGHSVNHILNQTEIQKYNRYCYEYRACRESCELGFTERHKSDRNGVGSWTSKFGFGIKGWPIITR